MIVIRFRTPEAMFRINADPDADFLAVLEELATKIHTLDMNSLTLATGPHGEGQSAASAMCGKTPNEMGLRNGLIFFAKYAREDASSSAPPPATAMNAAGTTVEIKQLGPVVPKQFDVDTKLDAADGFIKRPHLLMCRHGDKGMCEYCSPLPPWDKDYHKEHNIKHISFHSQVRQLDEATNNRNNALLYIAPLAEPNYKIDLGCGQGHAPYPKGICSKCQPSPITLSQQKFRMVDHVEFALLEVVNTFIDLWRRTGVQRYGIMYGSYQVAPDIPLGIKAVVEAVFEPPQLDEADGISLLPWDNEEMVNKMAEGLGLVPVGAIFTDLTDLGAGNGLVLAKRHKDLYFLLNLEIIMAARNQIAHPNPTKHLALGVYSLKFVTTVVSGGLHGEIEPRSYMVLASAEALVKADIIVGTTQPAEIMVNPTTNRRYVPDIAFSKINEYGLEVKTNAKPTFPVEFLLVLLTDAFPVDPQPLFETGFPVENRDFMGETQDLATAKNYMALGDPLRVANFHFLVFLAKMGVLAPAEWESLLRYVKNRDQDDYVKVVQSSGWMTFMTILEQS